MRAIIIDDERLARTELRKLLQDYPEVEVVDEAANADEGINKIDSLQPDLVFLDIQMPGKTGFDMLAELERAPHVIFTTAYDEYALKAFEVNALDYLLKPIEPKRLADAMQKLHVAETKENHIVPENFNQSILTEADQVFVKDGERCWFVKLSDIRLFESVGNYAKVFFGGNKPLILKSLNALEERLDQKDFFPCQQETYCEPSHDR
jgi:two-component system LytT family response regulator